MEEEEDQDIAAAMGFGSFGGTKKRKFDHTKSPKTKPDASGANSTQLGVRTKTSAHVQGREVTEPADVASCEAEPSTPQSGSTASTEMVSFGGPPMSRAELNALKFGVKNEKGDKAYFLPSFVEDPWEKLTKKDV